MEKINIDIEEMPKDLFYKGIKYNGEAGFINGYNGYTKEESDGLLCVVIDNSLFTDGEPNILLSETGVAIHSENRRGRSCTV